MKTHNTSAVLLPNGQMWYNSFDKTGNRLSLLANRHSFVGGLPVKASQESLFFHCFHCPQNVHATAGYSVRRAT